MRASAYKLERFGDDGDVLVVRLESDGLHGLYERIEDGLAGLGVPKSKYRTYKPHLTLAEGVERVPGCDLEDLKTITFDG